MCGSIKNNACIPKMNSCVSESQIRKGIENTNIGIVLAYTEILWKFDSSYKRIVMFIEWNKDHIQYDQMNSRLEKGDNIKIVNDTAIWHVYKSNVRKQEIENNWRKGLKLL